MQTPEPRPTLEQADRAFARILASLARRKAGKERPKEDQAA